MKKRLLLLLFSTFGFAQQFVSVLPNNNANSGFSRAPQGTQRYIRTCYVISPAEMTASGFPNATAVSALSFEYSTAQNAAITGTLKIYIENTTDATYAKTSTAWTNIISTMTKVHDASSTIPATTGFWDINFTGGNPFTYTGGGVYVAFEYENAAGTLATTGNVALCNTTITNGLRNVFSTTAAATDLTNTSNWRPSTRFAYAATCLAPSTLVFSNINSTSASVAFSAPSTAPANGYEYYVSTSSTAPTSTTIGTAINGTTFNLASLTPDSTYYVWIRSVCSATEKSVWVLDDFYTNAISPYSYSFENPSQPGWTILNSGTGNNWGIGSTAELAASGINYALYSFNATNAANAWLFSKEIELTAGIQYTVTFKVRARDEAGIIYPESMKATIGNARTAAAQTNILWDSTLNGINYITYTTQTGNFTPTTTGVYHLGFNCYSTADQFQLLLDDVSLTTTMSLSNNELTENDITIAPLPVFDGFNIKFENNDFSIQQVNVIDLNGRLVKSFNNQLDSYNVSNLNTGVYLVEIKSDSNTIYKKIIKK